MSMRATHLYLDKHIMSWMMNNNWSPGNIHCYSSYRFNSLSIRRRSFSYSNIRSFSYSNDLSSNNVKKSLKLTVVVDGNNFDRTYYTCEFSTMPDNDNNQGGRSGQGYSLPSASTSHTVILRQSRPHLPHSTSGYLTSGYPSDNSLISTKRF